MEPSEIHCEKCDTIDDIIFICFKLYWFQGETPLHTACRAGLIKLSQTLLEKGANPNAQTTSPIDEDEEQVYKQTPLHIGICHKHEGIVRVYLDYKGKFLNVFSLIEDDF